MKALIFLIIFSALSLSGYAQSAQTYFNSSASYYVKDKKVEAMQTIRDGLTKYPNDEKLKALAEKMKQEEKKKDQDKKDQDKKDQQKKEQEKKDQQQEKKDQEKKSDQQKEQEKKDQEKKDDKENKNEQEKNKQQKEQEKKDKQKQNAADPKKLQEMNITEDMAKKLLDAMKAQEVQYIQQNKRKATKSKDKSKPDW